MNDRLSRADQLQLASFIDDHQALSTTQMDRLVFRCREDAQFLQTLAAALDNRFMLDRLVAADAASFADRVVAALPVDQRPQTRRVWWLVAAVILMVCCLGGWRLGVGAPRTAGLWSTLLCRLLWAGMASYRPSSTTWRHQDGSLMTLQAGSEVQLGPQRVVLLDGSIAVVASQRAPDDPLSFVLPHGVVSIVGTVFSLASMRRRARLPLPRAGSPTRTHTAVSGTW